MITGHCIGVWLQLQEIWILNVAGPKDDKCPGIHKQTSRFLKNVLSEHNFNSEAEPGQCI